jgi:hypothetical protein
MDHEHETSKLQTGALTGARGAGFNATSYSVAFFATE